jgi:hypothetical protein
MSQAEALKRIKEAARTGETTLSLFVVGLTSLPPEIAPSPAVRV